MDEVLTVSRALELRNLRTFFVALVVVALIGRVSNASAETDPLLEVPPPAKVEAPVTVEKQAPPPSDETSKTEISFLGGPAFNSYRLSGSGVTSTIPISAGSYFGLNFTHSETKKRGSFFKMSRSENQHGNFTSVSPSLVMIRHTRIEAGITLPLNENWRLAVGYGYSRREGTQTTPTAVVGQHASHGLVVGLENGHVFSSSRWRLLSHALLRLPLYFYEAASATGSHVGSTEAEIGSGIFYRIWRQLELAVNAQARASFHFYRGSGSRGVSEGREQDILIFTPLEVRWTF